MFDTRASFTVVYENKEAVFIVDDNHGLSITNDAEAVCRKLLTSKGNKRIIYRDTDGQWDELWHNSFIFTGFQTVTADDTIYETLQKVKSGSLYV